MKSESPFLSLVESPRSLLPTTSLLCLFAALGFLVLKGALGVLEADQFSRFSMAVAVAFMGGAVLFLVCWKPETLVHLILTGVILDQWEGLGFIGIPYLTFSKSLILMAVFLLLARAMLSQEKQVFQFPTAALAHIPFSLVCLISTLAFAYSYKHSARWLIAPLTLPVMAIVLAQFITDRRQAVRLTKGFVLYSFFPMAVAGLEAVTRVHVMGPAEIVSYGVNNIFRVAGNFENPNDFVVLMLFSIPLLYLWAMATPSAIGRIFLLLGAALQGYILLKTYSRSGYISMGFAFFSLLLLSRGRVRWMTLGVCLIGVGAMLCLPDVRDRLLTLVGIRSGNVGLAQAFGSINIRKILMLAAWGEFLKHPILGIGFANLGFRVKSYSTLAEGETAENTYLQILAELGIVGLLAYLLFMVVAWRCLWRGLLECRKTPEVEPFYLGIAAGYCGFAFNCLLDTNLQDNLPWVLLPVMAFLARPSAVPEPQSSSSPPS